MRRRSVLLPAVSICHGLYDLVESFRPDYDVAEAWRHAPSHTYIVFRDKYTDAWEQFIIDNNLGRRVDEGVTVSKHLGLTFMTLLAQVVSAEQEIPLITDCPELDSFGIFLSHITPADPRSFHIARSIINVTIPANLDSIALSDIIAFRNRPEFKDMLHAFHQRVQDYIQLIEGGFRYKRFQG